MPSNSREINSKKILILPSMQGHNPNTAHTFNHTNGACPKCGFQQQMMCFCLPGSSDLPKVRGCELDGEHLHRLCAACKYPWIERCLDLAVLSQAKGEMIAESDAALALAAVCKQSDGLQVDRATLDIYKGWTITFSRSDTGSLSITSSPPPPQKGSPVHPDFPTPEHPEGQNPS